MKSKCIAITLSVYQFELFATARNDKIPMETYYDFMALIIIKKILYNFYLAYNNFILLNYSLMVLLQTHTHMLINS